jgi:hypothetical protein
MEDLNLYLAAVGVLREHGVSDASSQVKCEVDASSHRLVIAANRAVRPLLAPRLRAELDRDFDVSETQWTISPREAHKLIDRWAVL